jgi:hypothetical protein
MAPTLRLPGLRRSRSEKPSTARRELAEVDARRDRLIVSAIALAPSGFHETQDWVRELPAGVDAEALGAAVDEALRRSGEGHIEPEGETFAAQLKAAGVKSWSQYVRGLTSVRVDREGEKVELLPFRNLGARQGLHELPEQIEILTRPDAGALGSAVVRGLARSSEATP